MKLGLVDCTNSPVCTKIADLKGGYGTTGMRVVFSLPLDEFGLHNGGGKLKDVKAFSGLGSCDWRDKGVGHGAAGVIILKTRLPAQTASAPPIRWGSFFSRQGRTHSAQ